MLYLVATPIGNLGDITLRALEALKAADVIACEDTRHTRKLLSHYDITKPLVSFHEHNERHAGARLINMLQEGRNVALVTDAGTPGVSDPGFSLVRAAVASNQPVTMVPGPAAFVMAIVLSGLATHAFTFRGFPPRKRGPRVRFIAVDRTSPHTLAFYESPHRLLPFLKDLLEVLGDRRVAVAGDLTKKFEQVHRGTLSQVTAALERETPRGEYCVIVEGVGASDPVESERTTGRDAAPADHPPSSTDDDDDDEAARATLPRGRDRQRRSSSTEARTFDSARVAAIRNASSRDVRTSAS